MYNFLTPTIAVHNSYITNFILIKYLYLVLLYMYNVYPHKV